MQAVSKAADMTDIKTACKNKKRMALTHPVFSTLFSFSLSVLARSSSVLSLSEALGGSGVLPARERETKA